MHVSRSKTRNAVSCVRSPGKEVAADITVERKGIDNNELSYCIDLSKNDVKCGKFMLHEIWLALQ